MSMTFLFRALSNENEHFIRDYEICYDTTLLGLHEYICSDLDFDPLVNASFFLADSQWDELEEFTLMDMASGEDAPRTMESVALGGIIHENGDRLIYTFDPFGERSLYLELMGAYKAEEGVEYPHTALSEGDAPPQFDAAVEEDSIFDEAMGEFGIFDGDESYEEEF